MKARLAVLVSGRGSNLAALINSVNESIIDNAEISLVISDREDAYALKRAEQAGIPWYYLDNSEFVQEDDFDLYLIDKLADFSIDAILLAGYLKILTKPLLDTYKDRILNIHPSLLPNFGGMGMYGMHVHEAVIKAGVHESGCTVHLVDDKIDGGKILAQTIVPVLPNDSPKTLADRVLIEEHKLYPATVRKFVSTLDLTRSNYDL